MSLKQNEIQGAIQDLGLSYQVICIHSALSSFGYIQGGANAVINAFLGEHSTVLVPTFSYSYAISPPSSMRPPRNGWNYKLSHDQNDRNEQIFKTDSDEIDGDMGIIPKSVLSYPDCRRGYHPLNSFSVIGPQSEELISEQSPMQVYAPLKKLVEMDGYIILMGVDLTKMTLLHLAEQEAGRNLFLRWAKDHSGDPMYVKVGGCSNGFINFEKVLKSIEKKKLVGESLWKVYPAKETLNLTTEVIQNRPSITHCSNPNCERCNDAIAGGPMLM